MGSIEFADITERLNIAVTEVPENANLFNNIRVNNLGKQMICLAPIIVIFGIIILYKLKKNKIFDKEERERKEQETIKKHNLDTTSKKALYGYKQLFKYILIGVLTVLFSLIAYNLLRGFIYSINGIDSKIGYSMVSDESYVIPKVPIRKFGELISIIFSIALIGILPLVMYIILYPKKIKKLFTFLTLNIGTFIFLLIISPDLVTIYRIVKHVPNNAYIQISGFKEYWFLEEDIDKKIEDFIEEKEEIIEETNNEEENITKEEGES